MNMGTNTNSKRVITGKSAAGRPLCSGGKNTTKLQIDNKHGILNLI